MSKPTKTPADVRASRDVMQAAKQAYAEALAEAYPVGMEVFYTQAGHDRKGQYKRSIGPVEVIAHSASRLAVRVRGVSGAEYWLDAPRLITHEEKVAMQRRGEFD